MKGFSHYKTFIFVLFLPALSVIKAAPVPLSCSKGFFLQSGENRGQEKCRPCSEFDEYDGSQKALISECTKTENTKIECAPGFEFDPYFPESPCQEIRRPPLVKKLVCNQDEFMATNELGEGVACKACPKGSTNHELFHNKTACESQDKNMVDKVDKDSHEEADRDQNIRTRAVMTETQGKAKGPKGHYCKDVFSYVLLGVLVLISIMFSVPFIYHCMTTMN